MGSAVFSSGKSQNLNPIAQPSSVSTKNLRASVSANRFWIHAAQPSVVCLQARRQPCETSPFPNTWRPNFVPGNRHKGENWLLFVAGAGYAGDLQFRNLESFR